MLTMRGSSEDICEEKPDLINSKIARVVQNIASNLEANWRGARENFVASDVDTRTKFSGRKAVALAPPSFHLAYSIILKCWY